MSTCGDTRVLSDQTRDDVVCHVSAQTGVAKRDILSRSRIPGIFNARAKAMHTLRTMGYSFPQIGRAFGRDHATVIHAVRRVSQ